MIENILILDTETTGLFPDKGDKVIEIAAVLFNVKHKAILQCFSTLLPCDANPVEKINHISPEMTQCEYPFIQSKLNDEISAAWNDPNLSGSIQYEEALTFNFLLMEMALAADACVAHNAQFDKSFIATLPCGGNLLNKKWICTKNNFTWPVPLARLRLEDICNAMSVPYLNAHRAIIDCLLLAECFQKIEDLQERINRN
jgi:DNA polymerase-3 subunit epsilon